MDDINLDLLEFNTHSFIIRLWLEQTAEGPSPILWRGHITHVTSGRRIYVQDMQSISDFIASYTQGIAWRR